MEKATVMDGKRTTTIIDNIFILSVLFSDITHPSSLIGEQTK